VPAVAAQAAAPQVKAAAGILVDMESGEVMWAHNATVPRPPASLTKMLTALTAHASLPMRRRMIVSPAADATEPNKLGLGKGRDISVEQALSALMMMSANDMAVVLADHAAGSVERFSRAMDAQSEHLGLTGSSWRNPNGLDATGQRSTARDLAILARAVLLDPWLAELVSRRENVAFRTPDGQVRHLWNRGRFLRGYPDAVGVKTGYTDEAGSCLAGAATRGGRTLIAILLDAEDTTGAAASLMDWGFGPGAEARTGDRLPEPEEPLSVSELLESPPATAPTTVPPLVAPTPGEPPAPLAVGPPAAEEPAWPLPPWWPLAAAAAAVLVLVAVVGPKVAATLRSWRD
jgi:serine-type D-Ala-D-Ala carboxypeptidase (penicillin-binding protein 5/6)